MTFASCCRLASLQLCQYVQCFMEAEVDADVLPHLTNNDLQEMGIGDGSHRAAMLAAAGAATGAGQEQGPSRMAAASSDAAAAAAAAEGSVGAHHMAAPGSGAAVEVIQDSDEEGFWLEEEEEEEQAAGPAGGAGSSLLFQARQQQQQQQEQVAAAAAPDNDAPGVDAPCSSHAGGSMPQAGHDGGLWQDGCADDDASWELQQQCAEQALRPLQPPQPVVARPVEQGSSAVAEQQHMYRPVQAAGHAPQQQELPVPAASTGSAGTPATDQQQAHR
jgi:hypothetical protein